MKARTRAPKIDLDRIAFYGRCLDEYRLFFRLRIERLKGKRVLDCPSGASSFAAEASAEGITVRAVDPLFSRPIEELRAVGEADLLHVLEKARAVPAMYRWKYFADSGAMEATRRRSLELFDGDFRKYGNGRYIPASLPTLPFKDREFDLVLSGHFLFVYGDRLPYEFHVAAIKELVRVSRGEARIFPLKGLDAKEYPHYERLIKELSSAGLEVRYERSDYEFVAGWDRIGIFTRKED